MLGIERGELDGGITTVPRDALAAVVWEVSADEARVLGVLSADRNLGALGIETWGALARDVPEEAERVLP